MQSKGIPVGALEIEGTYRNGEILLDEIPVGITSARVIVRFLPDEADTSAEAEREAAVQRLTESMKNKRNFGGGPYYKNRSELYEED